MHFLFYRGTSPHIRATLGEYAEDLWEVTRRTELADCILVAEDRPHDLTLYDEDGHHLCLAGYVGNDQLASRESMLRAFLAALRNEKWPLEEEWFGSFACITFDAEGRCTSLANDALGYYPLYYRVLGPGELIAGTSQILLGRILRGEPDVVGLLEGISGREYTTYGRRTLIKNLHRLLPGEMICFSSDDRSPRHHFDNTLFSRVESPPVETAAEQIFSLVAKHVQALLEPQKTPYLALSGGWDSRLLLGAAAGKHLTCVTYGSEDYYETTIARRCAKATGNEFRCYPFENLYFPSRKTLAQQVERTEAVQVTRWLSILEGLEPGDRFPLMMLGDMCETIDGRNIKSLNSRQARIRSFWRSVVGAHEQFTPLDEASSRTWEAALIDRLRTSLMARVSLLHPDLVHGMTHDDFRDQLTEDIRLLTARVRENGPFFTELLDELFQWYMHGRIAMSTQTLQMCRKFTAIMPSMSFQVLRATSRIHPHLRLRRRLMNAIGELRPFHALAKIPSAQIPLVSMRAPAPVKEIVWGARSKADQWLTQRILRTGNRSARPSAVRSFNRFLAYERAHSVQCYRQWFSGRWFDPQPLLDLVEARATMVQQPWENRDIVAAANTSILLDFAVDSEPC